MKKNLLLAGVLALWACSTLCAQNVEKGISQGMLESYRKNYNPSREDKALRNALNTTPITTLAINSENAAMIDTHFSDRVATKGITDQKRSGRCWLFTGLNVLRADAISTHNWGEFEFS